ncbi:LOW QUALITY PROTEIN: hypothetical protein V2J09_007672 [Rumex salicifolius]
MALVWVTGNLNLEEELNLMRNKASSLFARAADEELIPGKKRKREVHNWMENAQEFKSRIDCIEGEVEQSSSSLFNRARLRDRILNITKEMEELLGKGGFQNGLTIPDLASSSLPLVTTEMKGRHFEKNMREILSWLSADEIQIIGVYGLGGVGKTTLAMHIHNQLLHGLGKTASVYCHWVTVSQDCTVSMLQEAMWCVGRWDYKIFAGSDLVGDGDADDQSKDAIVEVNQDMIMELPKLRVLSLQDPPRLTSSFLLCIISLDSTFPLIKLVFALCPPFSEFKIFTFRIRVADILRYFAMAPRGKRKKVVQTTNRTITLLELSRILSAKVVTRARTKRFVVLFPSKELDKFDVLNIGYDFVEVRCGITSRKYGDYVGRIKIFQNGRVLISCECFDGCTADNLSLSEFEKHTKPPKGQAKWKGGFVWAFTKDGQKVPLHKTTLLKYYKGSPFDSWAPVKPRRRRTIHRNEFVTCTKCSKQRRFLLRTKQECRLYHDACLDENWTCADFPNQEVCCEDDEERQPKKILRGCFMRPLCKGCNFCVCFGCFICRFEDCKCRSCVDFIKNAVRQQATYPNFSSEEEIENLHPAKMRMHLQTAEYDASLHHRVLCLYTGSASASAFSVVSNGAQGRWPHKLQTEIVDQIRYSIFISSFQELELLCLFLGYGGIKMQRQFIMMWASIIPFNLTTAVTITTTVELLKCNPQKPQWIYGFWGRQRIGGLQRFQPLYHTQFQRRVPEHESMNHKKRDHCPTLYMMPVQD